MRKYLLLAAGAVALVSLCALANVRLEFPTADNPGPPFYAQISNVPPFGEEIYHTEEWAAIPFYRDPRCVPPQFNLLDMFDPPTAFGCPLSIQGFEIWPVPPPDGAGPTQGKYWGLGAVPVFFVRWPELQVAAADRMLTMTELLALPSLRVGSASFFSMELHPSGAANVPHIEISARGVLPAEGRQFHFQVAGGDQSALVKHVKIVFW